MSGSSSGLARSIQTRLVRHAKQIGVDPNLVLTRFAVERFLYRLSRSRHAERFVLKGALLLLAWLGETIRPTRDADLLGYGELTDEVLEGIFREVCDLDVEPDGMVYLADSMRIALIRPEDAYGGRRITLQSRLGGARLRVQVDIGIGDAVSPAPEHLDYPSLLGLPQPRLRAYSPETAIAEKLQAMVVLGSKNSRMRDFFDVDALAQRRAFDIERLAGAVRATFARRETGLPPELPLALTAAFAQAEGKQVQWRAFRTKSGLLTSPETLAEVVGRLASFLGPVLAHARGESEARVVWSPGGPWEPR